MAQEQRLIDANALKAEIVDFKVNLHPQNQDYGTGYFSALSVVEGMLAYAPTVDAVEVVHGWWKPFKLGYDDWAIRLKCTVCDYTVYETGYKFCPNCGAKMRGSEE